MPQGVYLNGSLPVEDAETAFLIQTRVLGDRLESMTDGEFGWRNQWINGLVPMLLEVPGIELVRTANPPNADPAYSGLPVLSIDRSVQYVLNFGYAEEAITSYRQFSRLQAEGVLPTDIKFRVCLPTPYAIAVAFADQADQRRLLSIMEATIAGEINVIAATIPHRNLAIQFDTAIEIAVLEGAFAAAGGLSTGPSVIDCLSDTMDLIPDDIPRYLHTCYGDYHHTHFIRPTDLGLCVKLANAVIPDLVSMPADHINGVHPEYYHPLHELGVPRLALGVITYTGHPKRVEQLIGAALSGGISPFAVATECGLARITEWPDGPTLEQLLELHAQFSTPIR